MWKVNCYRKSERRGGEDHNRSKETLMLIKSFDMVLNQAEQHSLALLYISINNKKVF